MTDLGETASADVSGALRTIAFYLPQFHPVPENDEWWGKGFTEWTNVVKARPLFHGHYQPHLPADLGFYDLRLPDVRQAQADLARQYGIGGFCYYHYWFGGRRILERPFDEVLASGEPDFPFCLCWANENWTRAWDGGERFTLLRQDYCEKDDRAHIRHLLPAFADSRYIRIGGKPLFLVYRTEQLPDPARTAEIWREEALRAGVGEIYLARVEGFEPGVDPGSIGFDAGVEFAPEWRQLQDRIWGRPWHRWLSRLGLLAPAYQRHRVVRYEGLVRRMLAKPEAGYTRFRCVTPGFDNSARRAEDAAILVGNDPALYERWLREVAKRTRSRRSDDEAIVFINAWNEWAEGNHLEPDQRFGHAFLEATRRAIDAEPVGARTASGAAEGRRANKVPAASGVRRLYWKVARAGRELKSIAKSRFVR